MLISFVDIEIYAYIFDSQNSVFQKHPHFQHHKKFGFLCDLYVGTQLFAHFCCVLFILTFKRLAVYFCVLCPHIWADLKQYLFNPVFAENGQKPVFLPLFGPDICVFADIFCPQRCPQQKNVPKISKINRRSENRLLRLLYSK